MRQLPRDEASRTGVRVLHEASGSLGAPGLTTAWLHQTSSPRSAAGRAWLPPEPPATSSSCGAALTQASNCVVPAAPSTCSVWVPVGLVRPLAGELNSDHIRPFQVLGLASFLPNRSPTEPCALCSTSSTNCTAIAITDEASPFALRSTRNRCAPHRCAQKGSIPERQDDQRLRWSSAWWSPPPESNRRPHPHHGTTGNRCADRRSPGRA